MNISTHDRMDLCEVVAEKIAEIAQKQGKDISSGDVFDMLFGGDYCDTFDAILEAVE